MNHFSDLSLSPILQANLKHNNLTTPTPVQAQSIEPQLAGRDVVVTAQTGTGKTLAFVLPMLERLLREPRTPGINALILSPTRELAIQINESFLKMSAGTGILTAVVTGGANEQRQLHAIRNLKAQVVIATPGRLQDFLQRKLVRLDATRFLVLDEADRMLDMGFLPVMKQIISALPAGRQTMFFSATMEPTAAQLVKTYMREPVRIEIGSVSRPAEHVDIHLYEVDQDRKLGLLLKMLAEEEGTFLVFAKTKHGTDRLAKKLDGSGSKVTRIHGNRTQSQRNQALRGFQEGEYRVLVATDVAARGIHVDGIAHVVNFDLPQVAEDFVHRVGRTGRAGMRGTATTFATKGERGDIRKIEQLMGLKFQRRAVTDDVQREVKGSHAPERGEAPAPRHASSPKHAPFAKRAPSAKHAPAPKHTSDAKPEGQKHHSPKPKVKSPWQRKFAKASGPAKRTFQKRRRG